jgi:hypothetical protein
MATDFSKNKIQFNKDKKADQDRRRKEIEDSVSFLKGESSANPSSNL